MPQPSTCIQSPLQTPQEAAQALAEDQMVREYLMKLKAPRKPRKPPLSRDQLRVIERIQNSDPPIVVVRIAESGLHYSIGNGDQIAKSTVLMFIARNILTPSNDALIAGTPQSYRLNQGTRRP